jgi:hypothetical protein
MHLQDEWLNKVGAVAPRPPLQRMRGSFSNGCYKETPKCIPDAWRVEWVFDAKTGGSKELDLKQLDLDLCEKIRVIANDIYLEDPRKQIKPYTILARLSKKDYGRFQIHKDQLTLTCGAAQELSEGKLDYLLRDLPKHVEFLKKNRNKNITFNSLQSRRGYANCNEEERIRLETKLIELLNNN